MPNPSQNHYPYFGFFLIVAALFSSIAISAEALFKTNGKTYTNNNVSLKTKQSLFDVREKQHFSVLSIIEKAEALGL